MIEPAVGAVLSLVNVKVVTAGLLATSRPVTASVGEVLVPAPQANVLET